MSTNWPIAYLPIDSPIPYFPKGRPPMAKKQVTKPEFGKATIRRAADELARLTELRDHTDEAIRNLKSELLAQIGPLHGQHNELRGDQTLWDVRCLPVSTVAWKAIAEHMQPPKDLIAMHTQKRMQVSFKRMPLEVGK